MEDNDKPTVKVRTSEDYSTASVIVTFPFVSQAVAFSEICNTILAKMDHVVKPPKT